MLNKFAVHSMVIVFTVSVIGIGLTSMLLLSDSELSWIGILNGIIIGLFFDYKIYQTYKE